MTEINKTILRKQVVDAIDSALSDGAAVCDIYADAEQWYKITHKARHGTVLTLKQEDEINDLIGSYFDEIYKSLEPILKGTPPAPCNCCDNGKFEGHDCPICDGTGVLSPEVELYSLHAEYAAIDDHLFKNVDTKATRDFITEDNLVTRRLLRICDLIDKERGEYEET